MTAQLLPYAFKLHKSFFVDFHFIGIYFLSTLLEVQQEVDELYAIGSISLSESFENEIGGI